MDDSIRMRDCTSDDCAEVLALWKAADATPSVTDTHDELQRVIREGHAIFIVAVDAGGRVIGSVIGGWDGWRGNIYRLAVAPEARRRGLAGALVREVSDRLAREKGALRLTAMVEHARAQSSGFWNSMASQGYTLDPRLVRYVKTVE
jgi:ribosomal protein S18 acetylase RimI-like enzyme